MDFFDQQDSARRASRWLLLWYLLAVAFVVLCFNLAAAAVYAVFALYGAAPLAGGEPLVWRGLWSTYWHALLHVPPKVHYAVSGLVTGIILAVTARRIWQLSEGGPVVAHMLGAHYLERGRATASEAKLLNVVEEMAIASGIAVPPVYLLASDDAINALVAGHSPNEAVIVATRGAVQKLSRDELQGVMGHEFSHILNGDMALNVRLVGLLAGIACFGEWGEALVLRAARAKRARRAARTAAAMRAVRHVRRGDRLHRLSRACSPQRRSRRRSRASASCSPTRRACSSRAIRTASPGRSTPSPSSRPAPRCAAAHAVELSHMFFAPAIARWWTFPTHPPIEERIRRAHPRFQREDYRRTRHAAQYRDSARAVLDGAGNVVKVVGGLAGVAGLVEAPRAEHVDHARKLLERPAAGAQGAPGDAGRGAGGDSRAPGAQGVLGGVGRHQALLLIELALPALKQLEQKRRDAFLAEVVRLVEADRKVTLSEFVQATLLGSTCAKARASPSPPGSRKWRRWRRTRTSSCRSSRTRRKGDTETAHAKGKAILGVELPGPVPVAELSTARLGEALERLRYLQPFEKPRVLKACLEAAAADGKFRLAETELVRAVAATLDCPLPPVIGALDPATLAA